MSHYVIRAQIIGLELILAILEKPKQSFLTMKTFGNIIKDVLISITKYSYQLLDYTENHNYVVTNQNRLPQYYSFNEDTIYV